MSSSIIRFSLVLLIAFVAATLATYSALLPIGLIVVLSFTILIFKNPKTAIIILILTKPIIDATWFFKIPGIGLNFLQIVGTAFPILVFLFFVFKRVKASNINAYTPFVFFVLSNIISYLIYCINNSSGLLSVFLTNFVSQIGLLLQFLNSFAAFIIMPVLFPSYEERKKLFRFILLSYLFPVITAYLQIFGLMEGRILRTTGDLYRISGLYYDSTNLRMYSLQAIIGCYIYLSYFWSPKEKKGHIIRLLIGTSIPLMFYIVYLGYSKAAISIIIAWIVIYSALKRKLIFGLSALIFFLFLYMFNAKIQNEIDRLLYKEIMYSEGTLSPDLEYTLAGGRFVRWQYLINDFQGRTIIEQLSGYAYNVGILAHNDWIRILLSNGILGLITFIILIATLVKYLLRNYFKYKDGFAIAAILILIMFIIDSIGLVPLLYPGYCWFVFGIISLAINRSNTIDLNINTVEKTNANLSYA